MEATRDITIELRLTRKKVLAILSFLFIIWHPRFLGSETLTMTTYYPAPYGGYANLLTTGQTLLARDGGNLGVGTGANTPTSKVDIRGGQVQVADDGTVPDTASYGSFGVTRAASGSNLSYIGMTKAGTYAWGLGIGGNNSLIMGPAGGRTIPTPMFSLTTAGVLTAANPICAMVGYGAGTTSCPANYRVFADYSGPTAAVTCGNILQGPITGPLLPVCVAVKPVNGTMLCCRIQ